MLAKAVERASAIVAVGAVTVIPRNLWVLLPVRGSKRWWWRPDSSKRVAAPAEEATARFSRVNDSSVSPVAASLIPNLAEVHEHVVEAFVAQEIDDAIGDVALGDAVEGYPHARVRERDAPGGDGHAAVVDHRLHPVDRALFGAVGARARSREVTGVEGP